MKTLLSILFLATAAHADDAPPAFVSHLRQHLAEWDGNRNATLELNEIDKAIADPQVKGEDAATAVALRRGFKSGALESVSVETAEAAISKRSADKKAEPDFAGLYTWANKRLKAANRTLFVSKPPRVETLKQGKLGDCYCIAALRTVLNRDPNEITRIIAPQPDGSYLVSLGKERIKTPPLTDGEIILGASAVDGLWPLVYEKAVGLFRTKPDAKDATPFNVVTKGGSAGTMMGVLSAHEIKRWSCKTWRGYAPDTAKQEARLKELRRDLTSAFKENRLVTSGTNKLDKDKTGVPGITYNHGYAVFGYDAEKDLVHLWNPHADNFKPKGPEGIENGYTMTKGELRVPLKELVTFFGGFSFERLPLTRPKP